MSKLHRPHLLKIAQTEFESLKYDAAQATAVLPLRSVVERTLNILQRLLHDHLLDQNEVMQGRTANPPLSDKTPTSAQATPSLAPQTPHTTASDSLPAIDNDPRSLAPGNSVQIPGLPPVDIDPTVMNVVVTPAGSKVVAGPGAAPAVPASPIDPNGLPDLP